MYNDQEEAQGGPFTATASGALNVCGQLIIRPVFFQLTKSLCLKLALHLPDLGHLFHPWMELNEPCEVKFYLQLQLCNSLIIPSGVAKSKIWLIAFQQLPLTAARGTSPLRTWHGFFLGGGTTVTLTSWEMCQRECQ